MFDAPTLADFLHRCPSTRLRVLGDLIEEQPEDPYARAALAEANRLFLSHSLQAALEYRRDFIDVPGFPRYHAYHDRKMRGMVMDCIQGCSTTALAALTVTRLTADLAAWAGDAGAEC